ncbi:hypothetical protein V5799_020733 [Amblyomma americanum]|uniref:Uncharacterized protein n=1 Tax=Amblyomma americanum TaxID=6943 RepID=A0AAQ4ET85_AMBAM
MADEDPLAHIHQKLEESTRAFRLEIDMPPDWNVKAYNEGCFSSMPILATFDADVLTNDEKPIEDSIKYTEGATTPVEVEKPGARLYCRYNEEVE